jgi:hypothetical protein
MLAIKTYSKGAPFYNAFTAHFAAIDAVALLRHPPTRSATTTAFFLMMKHQIR